MASRLNRGGIAYALISLMALGISGKMTPADATYIVTLQEVGANVVATGGGSIDLTDLTLFSASVADRAFILASTGIIALGPTAFTNDTYYTGFSGPSNFGSGGAFPADSGSGDIVVLAAPTLIGVPLGYVSDSPLSDSATWDNQSFAGVGITPGTYTWTWGSGDQADSFIVQIGAAIAVPEPASLTILGAALLGLGVMRRRRSRTS